MFICSVPTHGVCKANPRYYWLTMKIEYIRNVEEFKTVYIPRDAHVDPAECHHHCMQVEPFATVCTVVRVPSTSPTDFMSKATWFANNRLWGTLSCSVLVTPQFEQQYSQAVQKMLDDLEYGGIAVNAYSAAVYGTKHAICKCAHVLYKVMQARTAVLPYGPVCFTEFVMHKTVRKWLIVSSIQGPI